MRNKTRVLVEGALAVAMTVAFSYIRLWQMPQGGLLPENVPLLIFALPTWT